MLKFLNLGLENHLTSKVGLLSSWSKTSIDTIDGNFTKTKTIIVR